MPPEPLAARFTCYGDFMPLVNPPNYGLVTPLFEWLPHFKIASDAANLTPEVKFLHDVMYTEIT